MTVRQIEARVYSIRAGLEYHEAHKPSIARPVACVKWLRERDRMVARIDECQRILGRDGKDGGQ
jgi:hypothetical protein